MHINENLIAYKYVSMYVCILSLCMAIILISMYPIVCRQVHRLYGGRYAPHPIVWRGVRLPG